MSPDEPISWAGSLKKGCAGHEDKLSCHPQHVPAGVSLGSSLGTSALQEVTAGSSFYGNIESVEPHLVASIGGLATLQPTHIVIYCLQRE